jgi:hypothetical protein
MSAISDLRHLPESIYVEVDETDYKFACNQSTILFQSVVDYLKNTFKYFSLLKFEKDQYDFKIINKNTTNGIHICIPPYNKNTIELYYIINNEKNYKKIILLDIQNPHIDIIKIIKYHMFNDEVQKDYINNVYNDLIPLFNKYKDTFKVYRNDYNISFVEISTNNGYNFYIDLVKSNYVCVRIIQDDCYHKHPKYNIPLNNILITQKYIIDNITQNKHNVPIVVIKITRGQYIGTSFLNTLIDDAAQNINISSSSSISSSVSSASLSSTIINEDASMDISSDMGDNEYDPIDI